jgi:hypothetical protein
MALRLLALALLVFAIGPASAASDPDEVVKAHMPQAELDLLNAHITYEKLIPDAPNAIVEEEMQRKKIAAWQTAFLRNIGDIKRWSAKIVGIYAGGSITLEVYAPLASLRFYQDVADGTRLYAIIRTLRAGQPVYISGRITETSLAIARTMTDNPFTPTCFDMGGCEIEITSIEPIE